MNCILSSLAKVISVKKVENNEKSLRVVVVGVVVVVVVDAILHHS